MGDADNKLIDEKLNSRRPSRFAWGIALGVGIGAIAVTIVIALTTFIIYSNWIGRFTNMSSGKVRVVKSSDRWLKMSDKKHGSVTGFSGSSSSSGRLKHNAITVFELRIPTQQSGMLAAISVGVYVTPKTKLTMAGKPWKPKIKTGKTPAETVFDMGSEDMSDSLIDTRELTIYFRREGYDLVAERIDASKVKKSPPQYMNY